MRCEACGVRQSAQASNRLPQTLIFVFLRAHLRFGDLVIINRFPGKPDVSYNKRYNK